MNPSEARATLVEAATDMIENCPPDKHPSTTGEAMSNILDAFLAHPDELLALLAAADDAPHVVDFRVDGWTLQHPLRERVNGSLFDCPLNAVLAWTDKPSVLGRREVELDGNGELVIGNRLISADSTPDDTGDTR